MATIMTMYRNRTWACGEGVCRCHYCFGHDPIKGYFCTFGCYEAPEEWTQHYHEEEKYFKSLGELQMHGFLHALDGAVITGELDKKLRVE